MTKYVRIGRVQNGALVPTVISSDVYTTVRRQRGGYPQRAAHSPGYEDSDIGRMETLWGGGGRGPRVERERSAERWDEKEIVPGLRVRVLRGQPWNAERLDTGQILLSPGEREERQPRRRQVETGEVGIGALFRDTDNFERVVPDQIPNGRGHRW